MSRIIGVPAFPGVTFNDEGCGHGHDRADNELGVVADAAAYHKAGQNEILAEDGLENLEEQGLADAHTAGQGEHIHSHGYHSLQAGDNGHGVFTKVEGAVGEPRDEKQHEPLNESY